MVTVNTVTDQKIVKPLTNNGSPVDQNKTTGVTTVPIGAKSPDNNEMGTVVQKTTTNQPSFEMQTMKWFGYDKSPEKRKEWDALSPEEKQKKSDIALKGMIDSYNDNQVRIWNGISEKDWNKLSAKQKQEYQELAWKDVDPLTNKQKHCKRMTVAEQYKLYVGRCSTEEEVTRLTKTVVSMDKDNQLDAFKNSYQYKNEKFRDIAEKILAKDYVHLHEDNIVSAAEETKNFSIDNQVIAAENAPNAVVSKHKALVGVFTSRKNHDIDMALSNVVKEFGVTHDANGKPVLDSKGKPIVDSGVQYECFETIVKEAKNCNFSDVIQNSAKKVCDLSGDIQRQSVDCIINTGDEAAIKVAASQLNDYKCSEKDKELIRNNLYNTNYESVKQEVITQEALAQNVSQPIVSSDKQIATSEPNGSNSDVNLTTEVKKLIESNPTNKDVLLTGVIAKASDAQKSALLDSCKDIDVIKAILASNPSMDIISKIMKLLGSGAFNEKDKNYLVQTMCKSGVFKGENFKRLFQLAPGLQKAFIENLDAGDLMSMNKELIDKLSSVAKEAYEKRLKELKDPNQKTNGLALGRFGFGILNRTA